MEKYLRIKKLPDPHRWSISSEPPLDARDIGCLDTAYTNLIVEAVGESGQPLIVDIIGTDEALPDASVEAAIRRLYSATECWRECDSNPPRTWKAVLKLEAAASPEAIAIAKRYRSWNAGTAHGLWNQSEEWTGAEDPHLNETLFKDYSGARYNIDSVLSRVLINAPPPGPLT
jgi:hypothetical protein